MYGLVFMLVSSCGYTTTQKVKEIQVIAFTIVRRLQFVIMSLSGLETIC
jgi:hypothetical protein